MRDKLLICKSVCLAFDKILHIALNISKQLISKTIAIVNNVKTTLPGAGIGVAGK